jgi:hypothetical protein
VVFRIALGETGDERIVENGAKFALILLMGVLPLGNSKVKIPNKKEKSNP